MYIDNNLCFFFLYSFYFSSKYENIFEGTKRNAHERRMLTGRMGRYRDKNPKAQSTHLKRHGLYLHNMKIQGK